MSICIFVIRISIIIARISTSSIEHMVKIYLLISIVKRKIPAFIVNSDQSNRDIYHIFSRFSIEGFTFCRLFPCYIPSIIVGSCRVEGIIFTSSCSHFLLRSYSVLFLILLRSEMYDMWHILWKLIESSSGIHGSKVP